jgi:hypothetical protein
MNPQVPQEPTINPAQETPEAASEEIKEGQAPVEEATPTTPEAAA